MRLSKSGRMGETLGNELLKQASLGPVDKRLEEERKKENKKHEEGTLELILDDDRKNKDPKHEETMLRGTDVNKNGKIEGTLEERLNKADKGAYPHRNEKAWSRTEEKRPVNALEGEMGESSDEKKQERWEKAQKKAQLEELEENLGNVQKGVNGDQTDIKDDVTRNKGLIKNVDDMGEDIEELKRQKIQDDAQKAQQQQAVASSEKRQVEAALCEYLKHKSINNPWGRNLKEAKQLDATMSGIMSKAHAEKRALSDDEKSQIEALKKRKTEVLQINWTRKQ